MQVGKQHDFAMRAALSQLGNMFSALIIDQIGTQQNDIRLMPCGQFRQAIDRVGFLNKSDDWVILKQIAYAQADEMDALCRKDADFMSSRFNHMVNQALIV